MGKPDTAPYLAWIDLETTGTYERRDYIIEVGLAITDRELNITDEQSWVVPLPELNDLKLMDDVVVDMHLKSGLIRDLIKSSENYTVIQQVDDKVSQILLTLGGGRHIPLAGSGVSHFDRRFIDVHMPLTAKRLSFWSYDVGVIRRFLKLAGYPIADSGNLTHRALEDVKDHIEEARGYLRLFKTLEPRTYDPYDPLAHVEINGVWKCFQHDPEACGWSQIMEKSTP